MWTTLAFSKVTITSPLVCAAPWYWAVTNLVAKLAAPHLGEGRIGVSLLGERAGFLGGGELQFRDVGVRDDGLRRGLQDEIATGVVAVVVGVDDDIEHTVAATGQPREEERCGVGELCIHSREHVFVGEPTDTAAAGGEEADVAPQRAELGDRWRRRGLGNGGGGAGGGSGGLRAGD